MIIVAGWFEVEPGERDAFVAGRSDAVRASRAQDGCLEYVVAPDPIEPGRAVLLERWESQAALDAHLAAARSATPDPAAIRPKAASVVVYDVSGEHSLV